MDVRKVADWKKPIPDPDEIEAPFYRAAARGDLLYQKCPACAQVQFYPRGLCTACGETPEWVTASGLGTVHTFTVIRQNHAGGFRDELPYAVAMVELDEGVKMMGGVTDCAVEAVHIGMQVEAYAIEVSDGIALPFWRPVAG
jgi:uncharacterized OB-fold protein